jgi:hypothetical protein
MHSYTIHHTPYTIHHTPYTIHSVHMCLYPNPNPTNNTNPTVNNTTGAGGGGGGGGVEILNTGGEGFDIFDAAIGYANDEWTGDRWVML